MKTRYVILLIVAAAVGFFLLGRATLPTFEKELIQSRSLVAVQQDVILQQAVSIEELKVSFREFSEKIDSFEVGNNLLVERINRRNRTAREDYQDFITNLEQLQSKRDSLREMGKKFDL